MAVVRSAQHFRAAGPLGWCLRAALMLAVGLCVLGWGTGYKLSLYNSPPQHSLELKAKLWNKANAQIAPDSFRAASAQPATLHATQATCVLPALPRQRRVPAENLPPLPAALVFAAARYDRPPPAI